MELVSRRRSPPASCRRGPRTRSYPFSSVSGFQGSRGVLSAPPRRFLPSAAQGDILRAPPPAVKGLSRLFPGKGRLMGLFRRTTWGDALRLPFAPRTHSLHKPRKGAGRRCGHLDAQGREPTKCSRARLTKRARSVSTPSNCRAESFEAKSAEGVGASLYIVAFCHAEIFPAS